MTSPDADTPRRGRPTVLDRGSIAAATFRLWAERGYAAVGWREIAAATGVSVRTLVRHFARKSEIAWVGVPSATRRLRTALDEARGDVAVAEAVRRAVIASIADVPMSPAGPDWIRVVCAEEELAGSAPAAYRPWIDELARFLVARVGGLTPAAAKAVASGYQAAAFAALVSWAEHGTHTDAADAVDDALRWFAVPSV